MSLFDGRFERSIDPPEPRTYRGRRSLQTVTIYIERDDTDCEVICEMDDGGVDCARVVARDVDGVTVAVVPPLDVELTRSEREDVEVDYSERCRDDEDQAREDAAEARAER